MATTRKTIIKDRETLLHKPFEYILYDSENPDFANGNWSCNFVGCAEDDSLETVRQVADLCNANKATFNFVLGDNFSHDGLTDINDKMFKTFFHDLHRKPTLAIHGNHEYGKKPLAANLDLALTQIEQSFIDPATGKLDPRKMGIWSETKVDFAELRKCKNNLWNCVGRYGVFHAGPTDYFVIDSSHFVVDFINFFLLPEEERNKDPNNQVAWLFRAVPESKAPNKVICSHHPFYDVSKRNIVPDNSHYLHSAHLKILNDVGISGNYSEILNKIMFYSLKKIEDIKTFLQKLWPDASEAALSSKIELLKTNKLPLGPGPLFSQARVAHYHSLSVAVSPLVSDSSKAEAKDSLPMTDFIPQYVSGGGGGFSQTRFRFDRPNPVLVNAKDFGIFESQFKEGTHLETLTTVSGLTICFENNKIIKKSRSGKISLLEGTLIDACRDFQDYLSENPIYALQPKESWLAKGTLLDWLPSFYFYSDDIQNFCNQFSPVTASAFLNYLQKVLHGCSQESQREFADRPRRFNIPNRFRNFNLNVPEGYFLTLNNHRKVCLEILNKKFEQVFHFPFDQMLSKENFLEPSPKPKIDEVKKAISPTELTQSAGSWSFAGLIADFVGMRPKPLSPIVQNATGENSILAEALNIPLPPSPLSNERPNVANSRIDLAIEEALATSLVAISESKASVTIKGAGAPMETPNVSVSAEVAPVVSLHPRSRFSALSIQIAEAKRFAQSPSLSRAHTDSSAPMYRFFPTGNGCRFEARTVRLKEQGTTRMSFSLPR